MHEKQGAPATGSLQGEQGPVESILVFIREPAEGLEYQGLGHCQSEWFASSLRSGAWQARNDTVYLNILKVLLHLDRKDFESRQD